MASSSPRAQGEQRESLACANVLPELIGLDALDWMSNSTARAGQITVLRAPERSDDASRIVCAAFGPSRPFSNTMSVGVEAPEPARAMKSAALIPTPPQKTDSPRKVIREPPITWMPSWW